MTEVAEAARHGAEGDGGAERHITDGLHEVEPSVALHVEHEVELAGLLVGEGVAHVETGCVEQHVDPAVTAGDLVDDLRDGVAVRQVDAVVASLPARRFD